MSSFCLHLTASDRGVSLLATEFQDGETSSVARCQRGTTTLRHNSGSFTWSQGVQGLVDLFLAVKIAALDSRQGSILGERGSLAASLDFSIAKNGQWLADMFGVYSDGSLRARRILRRTNPERKRPGPVEIFINPAIISPSAVTIQLDGRTLENREDLQRIRGLLAGGTAKRAPANSDLPESPLVSPKHGWFDTEARHQLLKQAFEDEILLGIRAIPVHDRSTSRRVLQKTFENPSYGDLRPCSKLLSDFIEPNLPDRILLGLANLTETIQLLRDTADIRVAMSASEFGSMALFSALNMRDSLSIELDYSYPSGGELLDSIVESGDEHPLLCVVPLAATHECWTGTFAKLYRPVMLMPESSKRVIAGPGAQKSSTSSFTYFLRAPSTASYFFDDLTRNGLVGKTWTADSCLYFNEAMRILRCGTADTRAVLWFPFYHFNIWLNGCSEVQLPRLKHRHPLNSVLFIRRTSPNVDTIGRSLAAVIRHVWLTLSENQTFVRQLAHKIAGHNDYVRTLSRMAGLHSALVEDF